MSGFDAVLVPGPLALLPEYAGLDDPLPQLRTACLDAVAELVSRHPDAILVVAAQARPEDVARGVRESGGLRVARQLLSSVGFDGTVSTALIGPGEPADDVRIPDGTEAVLVVASGSATRSEKAPGHLDERAEGFDSEIGKALRDGDATALRALDADLGAALWCHDVVALQALGHLAGGRPVQARIWAEDDPFGVAYWVGSWACGSFSTD